MAYTPKKTELTPYVESDSVTQAKAALDSQLAQKPQAYQSQWTQQLNNTINQINNRQPFRYDVNGDALYQQYKDRYIQQGRQAMQDTMGQAAALTGGYGNSYAQQVGQQTYQGYLQGLNDKIPELYQLAMDQYNREGNDLYQRYNLMAQQEGTDYNRYRDLVGDYNTERDYLRNIYDTERNLDYSRYADTRDFNYDADRDYNADLQWLENYNYQQQRDAIADAQWQAEFDEALRRWQMQWDDAHQDTGGSGGSGGSGRSGYTYSGSSSNSSSSNRNDTKKTTNIKTNTSTASNTKNAKNITKTTTKKANNKKSTR